MAGTRVLPALVGLLAVIGTTSAFAASGPTSWGKAIEVRGTAATPAGGFAQVYSVSCAVAGNCAAGGTYWRFFLDPGPQAFVVNQTNGVWRTAIEVPGTAALNKGGGYTGDARVTSVSCASAGNCAAGGYYTDGYGDRQAFVVSQKNGVWRTAIEVPGTDALNLEGDARVNAVSCATAGNCAAGGYYNYSDQGGYRQAFVVSEKNGVWGAAIEVPGTAALNSGGDAQVNSVSCATPGNCAAGGYYSDNDTRLYSYVYRQAFVVSEKHGAWGAAIEVPRTAALNVGDQAEVNSVSCAAAGNCVAGGHYDDSSSGSYSYGAWQAFVVEGDERRLAHRDQGARHRSPQHRRQGRGDLRLMRRCRQLHGRRLLLQRQPQHLRLPAGVRGQSEERCLAGRDQGAQYATLGINGADVGGVNRSLRQYQLRGRRPVRR